MMTNKVRELQEVATALANARANGAQIVQCHGVFDLLHIGHIRHLEQARRLGDVLVVTITPDIHVDKGPGRPAFQQALRAEALAALGCVDYVAVTNTPTAVEAIQMLRPDYYVKGQDYADPATDLTGGIALEDAAVRAAGGRTIFTDDIVYSSSRLINRYLPFLPENVRDYLARLSARYSSRDVTHYLEAVANLRVLVIGETIIDEYNYCEALGKSGKAPVLAVRYVKSERWAGGVIAVANNVAAFCDKVDVLTILGEHNGQERFIRQALAANVSHRFLQMGNGAPTIVKRRYVEVYPRQVVFEVYVMDDGVADNSSGLVAALEPSLPDYDVVVVVDYGHGMLGSEAVDLVCSKARFLAVNTQMNAGNRGFNTISKYRRADYICISENEVRLDARSRSQDLRELVSTLGDRLFCRRITVTRGQEGCLVYNADEGFADVPALAHEVVDRMGAGDAVLSVTSPCVALGAPMEVVGLVANAVGAQAVAMVGHRASIQKLSLIRHIEALLK